MSSTWVSGLVPVSDQPGAPNTVSGKTLHMNKVQKLPQKLTISALSS